MESLHLKVLHSQCGVGGVSSVSIISREILDRVTQEGLVFRVIPAREEALIE